MSRLPLPSRTNARPRFRLVRPESDAVILPFRRPASRVRASVTAEAPLAEPILPFSGYRVPDSRTQLLSRARALHKNRCCPNCQRGGVIPLDLGDGDDRHAAMPVPGASTLVGFFCNSCGTEWPS